MDNEFGMQELYFAQLKTTYPIEINGQKYAAGEVVAAFDKIQVANVREAYSQPVAKGGYHNRRLVVWKRTEGVDLVFTQGIFSKTQFSLMNSTRIVSQGPHNKVLVAQRDEVEANSEGIVELTQIPADNWIFIYNKETGEKLQNLQRIGEKTIQTPLVYTDVIVDYNYEYDNGASVDIVGEEIFNGLLSFEGRSRIKDDITGDTHTAIIKIPKLKITSEFNLTLGANAQPIVGRFEAMALPTGKAQDLDALEIYFLNEDIDEGSEYR